jgi:5-methylcytosine-specific restriction endonuclease McrA
MADKIVPYKDPEIRRENVRRRRAKDPEKWRDYNHRYYLENKDAALEQARLWVIEHPKEAAEAGRRYRLKYPEKRKEKSQRRRALKAAATIKPVRAKFFAIKLKECNYHCVYCLIDLRTPGVETHWDHVVPLSKGGEHSEENLVPTCAGCNLSKGAKDLFDFLVDGAVKYIKKQEKLSRTDGPVLATLGKDLKPAPDGA